MQVGDANAMVMSPGADAAVSASSTCVDAVAVSSSSSLLVVVVGRPSAVPRSSEAAEPPLGEVVSDLAGVILITGNGIDTLSKVEVRM